MNNNIHILRSITGSGNWKSYEMMKKNNRTDKKLKKEKNSLIYWLGLLDLLELAAPECEENYEEMITEQKRVYSQSWETLLQVGSLDEE